MNRRRLPGTAACTALPLAAGCLSDPGAVGGLLEVLETSAPQAATIVESSDDRIRSVEAVQEGLDRAADAGSSVAEVEVTEQEFGAVAGALPWYDRSEHDAGHISGNYVRSTGDERVYVVVLTPFCVDSLLRDAESERGEYGWGGCYDRAEWGY